MDKNMKLGGYILLTIGFVLLSGCIGGGDTTTTVPAGKKTTTTAQGATTTGAGPTTTQGGGLESLYTGFMEAKSGQWVEYVMDMDGMEYRQKMKNIGEDTINGMKSTGFEMEADLEGQKTVTQMWVNSQENLIKYAIKTEGMVMCMDLSEVEDEPPATGGEEGTPNEYSPDLPDISYGKYTTPTGKTMDVAIFKSGAGEFWVSSEIPFGMVKMIDADGKTIMYLNDYGLSGATRAISKSELDNCMDLSSMMGGIPEIPA